VSTQRARTEIKLTERQVLSLLLVVFCLAAVAWMRLVPVGEGPDEGSHLLFVQTLAGDGPPITWRWGLPVMATGEGQPREWEDPNFEVHQPPLYYWLAALLYRLAGLGGVRALALLCGALTVWLTWRLACEVVAPDLALAATAVAALLPMHQYLSGRVNNDCLANALWAFVLWRLVRVVRGAASAREGLWCGLGLGAALLTKQTALVLVPLVPLAAVLARGRAAWRWAAVALGVAAALALWWYLRNVVVYGDPCAQQAFDTRFLTRRPTPRTIAAQFAHQPAWRYWPFVWSWTVRSFVVYIGMGARDLLPAGVYPPTQALFWAAVAGLGVAFARGRGRPARGSAALLAAAGLLLGGLYVQFNTRYFQAQGRYFLPLLPGLALLLTAGLSRPFARGSALARYGLLVAPLWLALLDALLLAVYLPGLYEGQP